MGLLIQPYIYMIYKEVCSAPWQTIHLKIIFEMLYSEVKTCLEPWLAADTQALCVVRPSVAIVLTI